VAERNVNRKLIRAGFLLVLLGLITGLAVQLFQNPRMGLSAHLEGVLNGLLLVLVGLTWPYFSLPGKRARLLEGLVLYAAFVNWGATSLAAAWGTSRLTPLAGAGYSGAAWQELVSAVLGISIVLSAISALGLAVYSLRSESAR